MSAVGFSFLAGVRFECDAILDDGWQGREVGEDRYLNSVVRGGACKVAQLARIRGSNQDSRNHFNSRFGIHVSSTSYRVAANIRSSANTEIQAPAVRSQVRVNAISTRLKPGSTGTSICPVPSRVPARTTRPSTTTRQAG